jgi:hypothetical protein
VRNESLAKVKFIHVFRVSSGNPVEYGTFAALRKIPSFSSREKRPLPRRIQIAATPPSPLLLLLQLLLLLLLLPLLLLLLLQCTPKKKKRERERERA